MKKENKIYTAEELEELLSNRFSPPEWAFLPQVRNGTGFVNTARTADAIAMGLWPSRGLYLNGFEIKVRRSDWLNELKNPAKAEEIASYCDFWWVVAPEDIIKIEEVPAIWGLMIPYGSTLKIVKQAEKKDAHEPDKLFLAAILRKSQEIITPEARYTAKFQKGRKEGYKEAQDSFKYDKEDHVRLKERVKNFEKTSGVTINTWREDNIGEAVKMVLDGEHLKAKENLAQLLEDSKKITQDIEKTLKS